MNPVLGEALAHLLAIEGKRAAVRVEPIGTFHVRDRGPSGNGWGVLYVPGPAVRAWLHAEDAAAPLLAGDAEALDATTWLADHSGRGERWAGTQLAELATSLHAAIEAGTALEIAGLGTFAPRASAIRTLTTPEGGTITPGARTMLSFEPSLELKRRLARE